MDGCIDGRSAGKVHIILHEPVPGPTDPEAKFLVAYAEGPASVSQLKPDGLEPMREWTERRGQKYI